MKRKADEGKDEKTARPQKRARKHTVTTAVLLTSLDHQLQRFVCSDDEEKKNRQAAVEYLASAGRTRQELDAFVTWIVTNREAAHVKQLKSLVDDLFPHGLAATVDWQDPSFSKRTYANGQGLLIGLRGKKRFKAMVLARRQYIEDYAAEPDEPFSEREWMCVTVRAEWVHPRHDIPRTFLPVCNKGLRKLVTTGTPLRPGAHVWVDLWDSRDKTDRALTAVLIDYQPWPDLPKRSAPAPPSDNKVTVQVRPSKEVPKRMWGSWRIDNTAVQRYVENEDIHRVLADSVLARQFPAALLRFLYTFCSVW